MQGSDRVSKQCGGSPIAAYTEQRGHQNASDLLRSVEEALSRARNSWNDSCPSPSVS